MTAEWFDTARFGMFVHWGHVSQQGWELSWPLVGGLPVFPACQDVAGGRVPRRRDPLLSAAETRRATGCARARRAGMRYAVLTTKHHDGFALWPTRAADWSIAPHAVRRRPGARVRRRRRAPPACASGSTSRSPTGTTPTTRRSPTPTARTRSARVPRPTPEQWERFRAVLLAQLARAAHRLRADRPAVVRRRLGASREEWRRRRARTARSARCSPTS